MPFNIDERVKISTKVLAAGVIDGFEDAQWYETRFANSFSSLASDVYGLSPTTGFTYVTNNPAANLAAAQAAAAAAPAVIEDWTQGGGAYGGTAVQGTTAVRLTPVTGTNDANGFSTFAAYTTYNDFSSPRLTNWIKPQSVPQASGAPSIGYAVSLYNGDPNAGGTLISTAAGQGGSPAEVGWIFNADTGLLFLAEDFRATVQDPYIVGFRYIGDTLAAVAGASPSGLIDADGDTFITVEQTPDEDTIRMRLGDNSGNYTITQDAISTSLIQTQIFGAAAANNTVNGQAVLIRAGTGFGNGSNGGNVRIFAGTNGGDLRLRGGGAIVGSNAEGGEVELSAGGGDGTGRANDIRLRAGTSGALSGIRDAVVGIYPYPQTGNPGVLGFFDQNASVTGGNFIGFRAPAAITTDQIWTLPAADGSANQVLTTDGAGVLSWDNPVVSGLTDADGDTFIELEQTPDDDTLRLSVGDNTGDRDGTDLISINVANTQILGADALNPSVFGGSVTIRGGAGDPANFGGAVNINGGDNGGFIRMFAGSGIVGSDFRGGNVLFGAGNGDGTGIAGNIRFFPGAAGATSGTPDGNILFARIGNSGAPSQTVWEAGVGTGFSIRADASMAATDEYVWPTVQGTAGQQLTTDGSGVLSWENAASVPNEITDADADTYIRVEEGADDDTIRMSVGDNTGDRNGVDFFTAAANVVTLGTPSGASGNTTGAALNLSTGDGSGTNGSGNFVAGSGDAVTGGSGRVVFRSGTAGGNSGNMSIATGNADGTSGSIFMSSGPSTSTSTGAVGIATGNAGGAGQSAGALTIQAGRSLASGTDTTITGGEVDSLTTGFFIAGGAARLIGGDVLSPTVTGASGGIALVQGGTGAFGINASGGGAVIRGGAGVGTGQGGPVNIEAGIGDAAGGVNINGATPNIGTNSDGGIVQISAGSGRGTGQGGRINIFSGTSLGGLGDGGLFTFSAGSGLNGGDFLMSAGDATVGQNGDGGSFTMTAGDGDGNGTDGNIVMNAGSNTGALADIGGSITLATSRGTTTDGTINLPAPLQTAGIGGRTATLRLEESDNSTAPTFSAVGFRAPRQIAAETIWVLPDSDGTAGQALTTDGSQNLSWTTVATGLKTIIGTRASPVFVGTGGLAGVPLGTDTVVFMQGNGGPITPTTNPPIDNGTNVGDEIKFVGRSDVNTVTWTNGNGLSLNGVCTLGEDHVLSLMWDGTNWLEISRNV